MSKVADIKLRWTKSPSFDVKAVKTVISVDGVETEITLAPDAEEHLITVNANTAFNFRVITIDKDGLASTSVTYSGSVGDLLAPLPATDLFHEVVAVRDVDLPL